MIYSAKIRRMSRRRQKIAVRRRMRELLRTRLRSDLSPLLGQPFNAETMARIRAAVSLRMELVRHGLARLQVLAQEAQRARSNPPA